MASFFSRGGTGNSSSFFKRNKEYDTESVKRSIGNAQARIQDAGYKVEDADQRNWFEKATNLPQKQNFLFDTLELIQRPFQAIANPVNKFLQGKDSEIGSSFFKGLSGKERVRGSQLVENAGIDDKLLQTVLGTGVEIVADPISYVPGGALLKGAKLGTKAVTAPLKGAYKLAEKASPQLKRLREEVVQPSYESAKDKLGYAFNDDYKATETLSGGQSNALLDNYTRAEAKRRYLQEDFSKKLIDTAKTTGIEAGEQVGRTMEAPLRQFEDVKGFEFPDGVTRTTNKQDLMDAANINRSQVKTLGKETNQIRREYDKRISETARELEKVDNRLRRTFMSNENKITKQLQKRKKIPDNVEELATKKAFEKLSPSPLFNLLSKRSEELKTQLNKLRAESTQARSGNIERIKQLVDETENLKESMRNPVMIQKEIERIAREMPKDPKIIQAAESLMKSNAELRELAESEGIPISELEGYMTHILSVEEKARRKRTGINAIDRGNFGLGQPNKKVLNQRELKGSAEDVNELTGRKFFEPNAYFATAQGQRRLIDYIQSVSFRKNVLNDRNFARPYKKGMEVPPNAVVIDTNNYKFIKESGDLLEDTASKDIGGQYIVTKAAKQKLDKYKYSMTDEGSKAFLNTFDALQSFWKRAALFSLPYHLRNDVGAKFNNWVGGMSAADLAKYSKDADIEVFNATFKGKESPLYNEYRQQGLGATSQSQVEFARRGADPDKAIEKMVKEGSKDFKGKVATRLNPLRAFETSREFGDFIDQTNRYAAYKWAREKLNLSPEDAAKKVKELQFDYTKLSNFERDFAARAIPFYRWMRNNIPYQIRQFIHDPRKYANINKLRLNAQEAVGIDEENIPDWMKESFSIPVSSDGKGSGKMLGFNLPLGDLTKLSSPLKTAIDSISPVIKLPLELGINRNLFYNKPIEKFEGQAKQFNILGQEFNLAVKKAYALEQATGQIGRGLSGFLTNPESEDQDTKFRMPSFGITSVLKDFDANKATYFQLRDKLKELQDYISYIEQQTGVRPRTVNEINKGESDTSSFFSRSGQQSR